MLTEDDRSRVTHLVHRLRTEAGALRFPLDLDRCFAHLDLVPPTSLEGELDRYLSYRYPEHEPHSLALFRSWLDGVLGAIDPLTREVYVAPGLSPGHRRLVLAHELMHAYLGHCDLLLTNPEFMERRRAEMESEATMGAIELLCPVSEFRRVLLELTPLWTQPRMCDVVKAADYFQVGIHTALRRHVDSAVHPVALLTYRLTDRSRGRETPPEVDVQVVANPAWVQIDEPLQGGTSWESFPGELTEPVRRVLLHQSGQTLPAVVDEAAWCYGARADARLEADALHILLTR